MTYHKLLIAKALQNQASNFLFACLISHCLQRASRARAHKGFALPPLRLRSGLPRPTGWPVDGLRVLGLAFSAVW